MYAIHEGAGCRCALAGKTVLAAALRVAAAGFICAALAEWVAVPAGVSGITKASGTANRDGAEAAVSGGLQQSPAQAVGGVRMQFEPTQLVHGPRLLCE